MKINQSIECRNIWRVAVLIPEFRLIIMAGTRVLFLESISVI